MNFLLQQGINELIVLVAYIYCSKKNHISGRLLCLTIGSMTQIKVRRGNKGHKFFSVNFISGFFYKMNA
jgi:hypothetical protein